MSRLAWMCLIFLQSFAIAAAAVDGADLGRFESEGKIREAFQGYLEAFKQAPEGSLESDHYRVKVIELAYRLAPVPAIPPDAYGHFEAGMRMLQSAPASVSYETAYDTAIRELHSAIRQAPWWPIAYYDLALVQEISGRVIGAAGNFRFYLTLDPDALDAAETRAKIATLESHQGTGGISNSLGMLFSRVKGADGLFAIWDTRVQDYEAFARATGREWGRPKFTQTPLDPAVFVSWDDAVAFCDWLTTKDRASGWISGIQRYRLPTDAEWSIAVGLPLEQGKTPREKDNLKIRSYPWGDVWPPPPKAGNYGKMKDRNDPFVYTSPVGTFAPNRFGLYDMGGNVWQWCSDLYDPSQKQRVLRGASFRDLGADLILSSVRTYNMPDAIDDHSGFRCIIAQSALPWTPEGD